MQRVWKYPSDPINLNPSVFVFGPLTTWYFLLRNDFFFNKSKNTLIILSFSILFVELYYVIIPIININITYRIFIYLGCNMIYKMLLSPFEKFLFGYKIQTYKNQGGIFNSSFRESFNVLISLILCAVVFIPIQFFLNKFFEIQ